MSNTNEKGGSLSFQLVSSFVFSVFSMILIVIESSYVIIVRVFAAALPVVRSGHFEIAAFLAGYPDPAMRLHLSVSCPFRKPRSS